MPPLGAVIRKGAEGHTMTLGGFHWDLEALDRHQLRALGSTLSDAMGLAAPANNNNQSRHRRGPHRSK